MLENTSKLIKVFRDTRPIADITDTRLSELTSVESWLESWKEILDTLDITKAEKKKMFMTYETYSDLVSMIVGFVEICRRRICIHQKSITVQCWISKEDSSTVQFHNTCSFG